MKILHFLEGFSNLTETFVYDQIIELKRLNTHEIFVLTLNRLNEKSRPFVPVHVVPHVPKIHPERLWARICFELNASSNGEEYQRIVQRRIANHLRKNAPDLIHAHFGTAGILLEPIAKEYGIPLITSFYGYDVPQLTEDTKIKRRYASLFQTLTYAIVLSKEMGSRLTDLGCQARKIKIIHLAKNMSHFTYRPPRLPISKWITVGRLTEKKGHFDCIEAFAHATKEQPDTLHIIGDGELHDELAKFIVAHKLQSKVFLLGSRPSHDIPHIMQASDAFILCSKSAANGDSEGTPTVLLEAQAMGLPCVTTTHAGIPETIPLESHWLLAQPGDIEGLAINIQKLQHLSFQDLNIITTRGRLMMEKEFNLSTEAKKLSNIYSLVIRTL